MKEKQKSESFTIAVLLAIVGGFLDAYTYCCRDKVFANAQTGNFVRLGMSLSNGDYILILKYFIPIMAFSFGILTAMWIRNNNTSKLHWRQVILLVEIVIIVVIGLIPIYHITNIVANVLVSFLCAMQLESFKKVLEHSFSSTMCTGDLRSGTEYLYNGFMNKDEHLLKDASCYLIVIMSFVIGAFAGAYTTKILFEKTIMLTLIPMIISIRYMNEQR